MQADRYLPETEFWFVIRSEGPAFFARLLTYKKEHIEPARGELRSETARLLAYTALTACHGEITRAIIDPFAGSGTTLVACQNLSRRGRAIEISPAYCAVILQRMSDAFPHLDIYKVD